MAGERKKLETECKVGGRKTGGTIAADVHSGLVDPIDETIFAISPLYNHNWGGGVK